MANKSKHCGFWLVVVCLLVSLAASCTRVEVLEEVIIESPDGVVTKPVVQTKPEAADMPRVRIARKTSSYLTVNSYMGEGNRDVYYTASQQNSAGQYLIDPAKVSCLCAKSPQTNSCVMYDHTSGSDILTYTASKCFADCSTAPSAARKVCR